MDLENLRLEATRCGELGDEHLDALFREDVLAIYYRFLYFAVAELKPALSVELGTGTGRAAAHMAAAHPRGKVLTVDVKEHGGVKWTLAPYGNVEFVLASSDDPQLLARIENRSVGVCFIDSVHSGDYTLKEVELWTPKMKEGGLFLFDDLELNSSMKKVLPALPFEEKGLLEGLHPRQGAGFGYAVVRHGD
jgi:predicted O-methyltransferase YrrM